MIPVMQTIPHKPDESLIGNCYPSCVASLLEVSIDEVPHFYEDVKPNEMLPDWKIKEVDDWFVSRGIPRVLIWHNYEFWKYEDFMDYMQELNPNTYYILSAKSITGVAHAVICLGNEIVHNPNGKEIVGPLDDGAWGFEIIGVKGAVKA